MTTAWFYLAPFAFVGLLGASGWRLSVLRDRDTKRIRG